MASSDLPAANEATTTAGSPHLGFRNSSGVIAEFHRVLKMASFGYLGTSTNSHAGPPIASAEPLTSPENVATYAAAAGAAMEGTAATASTSSPLEAARSVGNILSYATSKWAIMCLFMTVLLNRTLIYAALRHPIYIPPKFRFALRISPILLLLRHIALLLFTIRCQTSVDFAGQPKDASASMPDVMRGYLHHLGTAGSFWWTDREVCEVVGLIPSREWIDEATGLNSSKEIKQKLPPIKGSLEHLWPLYGILSYSQFIEHLSCALTGRRPAAETGMTPLESSLAFAEAEALAFPKTYRLETAQEGEVTIEGQKLVPSEVLYIALIVSTSHLTSQTLGIFGLQSRFRLLSTGFFGMAFLSALAMSLLKGGTAGVLNFPTVCVVGFIPHLLILSGILVCALIYTLALLIASLFPPSGQRSFREGYSNLRANLTFSTVQINMSEDFYTTLLKLGFLTLTAASEATYLNEGRAVRIPGMTWLESERTRLMSSTNLRRGQLVSTGKGNGPYSRERKDVKGVIESTKAKRRRVTGKWVSAGELIRGVGVVSARWGIASVSRLLGIGSGRGDVEGQAERITVDHVEAPDAYDSESDSQHYARFLRGANLPEEDTSNDYVPPSYSPSLSAASSISGTPEPDEFDDPSRFRLSRESTPTTLIRRRRLSPTPTPDRDSRTALAELFSGPSRLASLLDPQSPEDRASAKLLARHLTSPHVLTRAAFAEGNAPLEGEEEESSLESVILARRRGSEQKEGREVVCVVCQIEPRTILVWPCRCLALCEDCRVCLAIRNFSNCVCCRQETEGFSRIYIP